MFLDFSSWCFSSFWGFIGVGLELGFCELVNKNLFKNWNFWLRLGITKAPYEGFCFRPWILIRFDMCGVSFFRVSVWFQWGVWVSLTENGVTLALCHLHLLLPRSYPSCQFLKTKRYPLMFSSIVYNFLISHEALFFWG